MTLTTEQFNQFVENYVSLIVEGLNVEQLETIAYDLLVREYQTHTEEQIVEEIKDIYGDEFAADLIESASDVPAA
jgi:thiol-disulfide isomerase/thioredoxin